MYRSCMLIMFALVLVACGGAATPTASSPTMAPTTTSTTTEDATAVATTATRDSIYASLPQSVNADGYYVLGNANAPAVMTHYSDLL